MGYVYFTYSVYYFIHTFLFGTSIINPKGVIWYLLTITIYYMEKVIKVALRKNPLRMKYWTRYDFKCGGREFYNDNRVGFHHGIGCVFNNEKWGN
jgi:hypothetical protein